MPESARKFRSCMFSTHKHHFPSHICFLVVAIVSMELKISYNASTRVVRKPADIQAYSQSAVMHKVDAFMFIFVSCFIMFARWAATQQGRLQTFKCDRTWEHSAHPTQSPSTMLCNALVQALQRAGHTKTVHMYNDGFCNCGSSIFQTDMQFKQVAFYPPFDQSVQSVILGVVRHLF